MHKNLAIKVQNLTKTYKLYKQPIDRLKEALHPFKKKYHDDFYALKNVSFEIKKGQTVGIIGRNGSGKSTLLKMITGVLTPTSGRLNVYGKISAILELGAGFNPELSGLENIYLSTSINRLNKSETDLKLEDIVEFSELGEFIYQPIKTYSSGMKARLGFAVAINIDPDLLIIDEALAVGDAAFQSKCYAKMKQIREAGTTILFVSHSESSIVSLCDHAIWLSNGEKVIEGKPKVITDLYMKNANKKFLDKREILRELDNLNKNNLLMKKKEKKTFSKQNSLEEFYDESLKPKSMICYPEEGAKINDVKITNQSGEKVNHLVNGKKYSFKFSIKFSSIKKNIQYTMMIKNLKGVQLGGIIYPSVTEVRTPKNMTENVSFTFFCSLNSGYYLFNCSVREIQDNSIFIVHKMVDTYLVKVSNNRKSLNGQIDFDIQGKIENE